MDKITRYLIILLSLIVFLVVAPLIILYVSGTRLNFGGKGYEPTGILTAVTKPSGAEVYLDDRSPDKSPSTIRFLSQGAYNVRIAKDGYFDWKKNLLVEPNQVTYAHQGVEAIHLIRKPQFTTISDSGVTCFALVGDTIWFGTAGKINWRIIGSEKTQSVTINSNANAIYQIRGSKYLIIRNDQDKNLLFDTDSKLVIPLPAGNSNLTDMSIVGSTLLGRTGNILLAYNLKTKVSTPILNEIIGFSMLDNTAYVAVKQNNKTILQTMIWNGNTLTEAQNLILDPLPSNEAAKLIITNSRELFILLDGVLYRANAYLETISNHVISANLDPATDELTFTTSSELWFYNFLRSKPELLTRNTNSINAFLIRSVLGYGFIGSPDGMYALEIDSRDQQNKYTLVEGQPVWSIGISSNSKTSIALIGDKLVLFPLAD